MLFRKLALAALTCTRVVLALPIDIQTAKDIIARSQSQEELATGVHARSSEEQEAMMSRELIADELKSLLIREILRDVLERRDIERRTGERVLRRRTKRVLLEDDNPAGNLQQNHPRDIPSVLPSAHIANSIDRQRTKRILLESESPTPRATTPTAEMGSSNSQVKELWKMNMSCRKKNDGEVECFRTSRIKPNFVAALDKQGALPV